MPDAFVPFFSQVPERQSAGSRTGKDAFVPADAPDASVDLPAGQPSAQHRPVVKLQREGDRVRTIRVECSCGQIIELDCTY